uniref:Uncharacterized protein n=1 Tax=Cacopsylla melanoneura TaxID=428564 RepID=A0A8D8Z8P2_9HEMI
MPLLASWRQDGRRTEMNSTSFDDSYQEPTPQSKLNSRSLGTVMSSSWDRSCAKPFHQALKSTVLPSQALSWLMLQQEKPETTLTKMLLLLLQGLTMCVKHLGNLLLKL